MAMRKCLIIGAGLAGATAARLLAEKGDTVHVIEKQPHVGGNCYDGMSQAGVTIHKYGPHIFHTNMTEVWDFCQRFADFNFYQHRVMSYVDGQLLPFPINRDTICQLFGIDIGIREIEGFLADEVARSTYKNPPENFRDAVISQVGTYLYEKFFHNYTRKQWAAEPESLSAEIAGRIPIRYNRDNRYFTDLYQGLPIGGYTHMIKNMLDHPSITLEINADYFLARSEYDKPGKYDLKVYTGKLDSYFDEAYGRLDYRSVKFDFRYLDQKQFQPAAVVNYPNDYAFTRITEFKHMTNEQSDKTALCIEYPSADGVPSYVVLNQENIGKRQAYFDHVHDLEEQGGTLFVGRLAEYRYYNMDQVIAFVMKKLK
jgi:UDP-galactopyranose mutase